MKWLPATLPLLAGLAGGCDTGWVPRRQAAITYGAVDPGDPHVVALRSRQLTCGAPAPPDCTGTLVAPRVVLTSAHCVDHGVPGAVEVFFGEDAAAGGDVVYVEAITVHPDWDEATRANDLALVLLAVAVPIAPAPLASALDDGLVGATVRLVGFGSAGEGTLPGVKRSGTAVISSLDAVELRIAPAPSMSCHGDSGGPVFVTVAGAEVLAGVTSWGDPECVELGVNARVDAYLPGFIQPYLDGVAQPPDAPDGGPDGAGAIDVCAETCADHADCPAGTVCRPEEGVLRCGVVGLPAGSFGGADPCESDEECGGGRCVARESSGRPACSCYALCEPPPPPGCGCSSARPGSRAAGSLLAVVCAVAFVVRVGSRRGPGARGTRSPIDRERTVGRRTPGAGRGSAAGRATSR